VGNPPFQDSENRGKTQHKLWIDFTKLGFYNVLSNAGRLGWVTPASFSSPSNQILSIFKNHICEYISFDTNQYFKEFDNDVGIKMAHYIIKKSPANNTTTHISIGGNRFDFIFGDDVVYLPNDLCKESISIHRKVLMAVRPKLQINYDYVTCHNVQLARKDPSVCPISKTQTSRHIYPILHTNSQIWYSEIKQPFFDKKKVMWSRSGETRPQYNDGTMGMTDMGYYVEVSSSEEGQALEHNLKQKLFTYLFKTAKWSGFGNEKVFSMLPVLPNHKCTDNELYTYFDITTEEITYINDYLSRTLVKSTVNIPTVQTTTPYEHHVREMEYMNGVERDELRIKRTAEVFTPTTCVLDILNNFPDEVFINNETFLDPSCGDGQFLVEVVNKKMQYGHTLTDALRTTYGVELMQDNVTLCKKRLMGPTPTKEIQDIVNNNIVCHDALTYDYTFNQALHSQFFGN